MKNTVYTVVLFSGAADALSMDESSRKSFQTARAARSYARARCTKVGGSHAAGVYLGRPTCPIAEHVADVRSVARSRFLASIAGWK